MLHAMPIEHIPVSIQTLYADLTDRARSGDLAELMAGGGAAYSREVRGRLYWYWQPPTVGGVRPAAKYLGADGENVRARLEDLRGVADAKRERVAMVAALRGARMPTPDALAGAVLGALSAAGAFRLRAVVVGSVAFQSYPPMLGVRLPEAMARTGDVDVAEFHSIAMAVDDDLGEDFLTLLRAVDRRFVAVPSPLDGRKTLRYALRVGLQELFSVDVLSPLRGPDRPPLTYLRALRAHGQLLRFLDFLLYREVNAVALHGPGVPINVPAPERFALHKLLVSQFRAETAQSQTKSRKDLAQAAALIRVLSQDRPLELKYAWDELRARGPSWRRKADASLPALDDDVRRSLLDAVG